MNNVYNDPAYANVVEKLHEELDEIRMEYGDSKELDQHYMELYKKKN